MNHFKRLVGLGLLLFLTGCDKKGQHGHDHEDGHTEHAHDEGSHGHDHAQKHGDHHGQHDLHDHPHDENEHVHDAHGVAFTRWGEHFELFAEHSRAISKRPWSVLAHVTRLRDFRAISDGKVEAILKKDGQGKPLALTMLRAGMFQAEFEGVPAGTYELTFTIEQEALRETLPSFSVTIHPSEQAADKAAEKEGDSKHGTLIPFSKEQQWQIPFGVALAREGDLVPTIEVTGEVTTPPGAQAEVGAAISGRLIPGPKGLPLPGQEVTQGTLLATIAPAPAAPEESARAQLAVVEAESRQEAARAQLDRAERLIKDGATSQKEVEDARRELEVAENAVKAAKSARSIFTGSQSGQGTGTYRLTAPISGVVVEVLASTGQSVTSGERLFHIVSTKDLWIRAKVPEQAATRLRPEANASFLLPGLNEWLPLTVKGETANASVVSVGRTVHPRSRTVDLTYSLLAADPRLRVGGMVRVAVPVGETSHGVLVPRSAVIESEGRSIVFVQVEGESFEERPVRVTQRSGDVAGVEKGVRAGERVVTEGANVIRLSVKAEGGASHGHVH